MLVLSLLACKCDTIWYIDSDLDGFGNSLQSVQSCEPPYGYVAQAGDCLDSDAEVHPDAAERCDNLDNNCDGNIDEEVAEMWYRDRDGDGWGSIDESEENCNPGAGWVAESGDCDDFALAVNPDAVEICDEIDQNCDGTVDEGVTTTFYVDADNDGYGDDAQTIEACSEPGDASDVGGDCDDANELVSPGATEYCDDLDNNCDGNIDEGVTLVFYEDADGDGYGVETGATTEACAPPQGYAQDIGDCDDSDTSLSPGVTEDCFDQIDNNCNSLLDCEDSDCATTNGCFEADCTDGQDGDDDSLVDCLDDDCWVEPTCVSHAVAKVTSGTYKVADVSKKTLFYGYLTFSSSSSSAITASNVAGKLIVYGDFGTRSCDWGVGAMNWSRNQSYYGGSAVTGPNRNSFTVSSACPWSSSAFLPGKLAPAGNDVVVPTSSVLWYHGSGSSQSNTSSVATSFGFFTTRTQSNYFLGTLSSGSGWYWQPN